MPGGRSRQEQRRRPPQAYMSGPATAMAMAVTATWATQARSLPQPRDGSRPHIVFIVSDGVSMCPHPLPSSCAVHLAAMHTYTRRPRLCRRVPSRVPPNPHPKHWCRPRRARGATMPNLHPARRTHRVCRHFGEGRRRPRPVLRPARLLADGVAPPAAQAGLAT